MTTLRVIRDVSESCVGPCLAWRAPQGRGQRSAGGGYLRRGPLESGPVGGLFRDILFHLRAALKKYH